MSDPNIAVAIAALRGGKTADEALEAYCFAKYAVPILRDDMEKLGDPMKCHPRLARSYAAVMAADAMDAGGDDAGMERAFRDGLARDYDMDILWRTMAREERPSAAQLARHLSVNELHQLSDLIGVRATAELIIRR